jgi:hypothetical protein
MLKIFVAAPEDEDNELPQGKGEFLDSSNNGELGMMQINEI